MKKLALVGLVVLIVGLFFGCAARQTVAKTPEPTPDTSAAVVEPSPEATVAAAGAKYVVQKGDTLWGISSMGKIYEDPFQWPLLFKANRDAVADPDLIDVGQELEIRKDFGADEVTDAKQKAKDTPPYKPHTAPRKKLPLKY
jgi:LysM repeat protein